jgi:hypothetical protein
MYLGGDDEDDELDGALDVRCEVILVKVWDHIFFFVESFIIDFVTVKNIISCYLKKQVSDLFF